MLRLGAQCFLSGDCHCIESLPSTALCFAPTSLDQTVWLEPYQGGINRALVQVEQPVGDLLQARCDLVRVLGSDRRQIAQDDQIQRSLEDLMGLLVFTRHPSGPYGIKSPLTTLECQVQASTVGPPEPTLHFILPELGARPEIIAP